MKLAISAIFDKIKMAYEQKRAFVVYRKPHEIIVKAQFLSVDEIIDNTNFDESGFIFAPFNTEEPAVFFPLTQSNYFESEFLTDSFFENHNNTIREIKSSNKDFYLKLIEKAIQSIHINTFKKVVLSRKEEIKFANFELIKTFQSLLQLYPNAMVYCWFHPKIGLWMGATPELLCKVSSNQLSTVSLAGTQSDTGNEPIVWGEKEQVEQQLVTDYIVNELKDSVKNLKISNPYSVKAGHLWHIKTDIVAEIIDGKPLQKIVQKLHPTPAVCGFPKNSSKKFILQNEGYNREFYTGFLGELHQNNSTELYVNLRCMKIEPNNISIFVGGGITHDSHPENEWNETIVKAETMKKVL